MTEETPTANEIGRPTIISSMNEAPRMMSVMA
jgi:hypothetical protein